MQADTGDHSILRRSCRLKELRARKEEATLLELACSPASKLQKEEEAREPDHV